MPTQIVWISSNQTGVRVPLVGTDDAYVAAGTFLGSINDAAIRSTTSSHVVTVMGGVYGGTYGIDLGGIGTNGNSVIVGAGGSVVGYTKGVRIESDSARLVNYGLIEGDEGVYLSGTSATLVNHGSIASSLRGIAVEMVQANGSITPVRLTNFGDITSTGVAYDGDGQNTDIFRNFGKITGEVRTYAGDDVVLNRGVIAGSLSLSAGLDRVDNSRGQIEGDVSLGAGDDIYLGKHGIVTSIVFGEEGNDTLVGNALEEDTFDGGIGTDTLDFRKGPAAIVALDGSFDNDGAAFGDSYTGFEEVMGSTTGADLLRGDGLANSLIGFGGKDTLDGASGADTLRGGNGVDSLTGGGGNDQFRYQALSEMGDTITDFSNVGGNDDQFVLTALAFGGGLVAGALAATQFQIRADNAAQDADDRFIFRTTDQTLWFDADGTGSSAARMLADLQASAVLTAADILLV